MKQITAVFFSILVLVLITTGVVLAQPTSIQSPPDVEDTAELLSTIRTVVDIMFTGLLVFAVIMIIVAAYLFISAGGDPTKLSDARMRILWALVAVVIGILARGMPTVVQNLLQ